MRGSVTIVAKIPSINALYRRNPHGRGMYITPAGEQFKSDLGWEIKRQNPGVIPDADGRYQLDITIHLVEDKRDVDNYLKVILDAIQGIVYENDNQVQELTIRKQIGVNEGAVITWGKAGE